MAKRFIDTDLFKKPRFKELKAPYKLLWVYLMCECNHAGLWNVELDVAGLRIGQKLPDDCATIMGHMIKVVDSGRKWWLKDFVRFQYGGELVTTNRLHASVVKELEAWGLLNDLEEIDVVERGSTVSAVRHRLSRKAKNEVLMRDELTCQYCGEQRPMAELVVDHVVPVINGGDNDNENLVACCVRCNGHKTDLSLDEFIGRGHPFLNPSEGVIKKLNAPFKPLLGAKDKDKDKDKDNSSGNERVREAIIWPAFEDWWKLYSHGSRKLSAEQWAKISQKDREAIMENTPLYIASRPDPKFRKHGERYLKNRTWEDPIINSTDTTNGKSASQLSEADKLSAALAIAESRRQVVAAHADPDGHADGGW